MTDRHRLVRGPLRRPRLLVALLLVTLFGSASVLAASDASISVRARSGVDIDTMDPAFYRGNEEFNLDLHRGGVPPARGHRVPPRLR